MNKIITVVTVEVTNTTIDIHLPTMGTSVFMLAILVIVFCFLCMCYHKTMKRVRRNSDHREIKRLRKAQQDQELETLQHLVWKGDVQFHVR